MFRETLEARVERLEGLLPNLLEALNNLRGGQALAIQEMQRTAQAAEEFREATRAMLAAREKLGSDTQVH